MKFPKVIRHRKAECKIYGKKPDYPFYRVAWYVTGQRRIKQFRTYSEARIFAEQTVKDLAKGSQATALTPAQAVDALAAFERLRAYCQRTGRKVSLLRAMSDYADSAGKLSDGQSLCDAVDGFLGTVASIERKDIAAAVEDFIETDEPRTKSNNGQRAQLSSEYTRIRALRLRRFAKGMPGHSVCDLTKEHLDVFIKSMGNASPKARNHHRAGIKQFLQWAVRKDFLPVAHRLLEADSMRPEHANNGEVEFYNPKEFRAMLEASAGVMQAIIAIGGFAGLRTAELLRLTWQDVWRVSGHIEVTSGKSKNRSRRLVEACAALDLWLEPFRQHKEGKIWTDTESVFQKSLGAICDGVSLDRKRNGLRHSFVTFHYALHGNENLTAQQAGNSPTMIHQHYKGLATKAEGEKWFNVQPAKAANVVSLSAMRAEN